MVQFSYTAIDSRGQATKGTLQVTTQHDALMRLRDLGLFPLAVTEKESPKPKPKPLPPAAKGGLLQRRVNLFGLGDRVKPRSLAACTRQLATLTRAGLPLLRSLRAIEQQERHPALKDVLRSVALDIESGGTFSEGLARHPKVFNRLYVNMVKAGELGGVLEVVLFRLAEFMEKAGRIKRKIVAAMFYPLAVLTVAAGILGVLLWFVVPRFKLVFADLMPGKPLPPFTQFVVGVSEGFIHHLPLVLLAGLAVGLAARVFAGTQAGRLLFDRLKLNLPVVGTVIRKAAISRFTRTLGTLVSSGVPILQALTIVKETSGNQVVANAVGAVHESVKEGDTITAPLAASGVFPPVVISMVDVGEQTGALPEMLLTIANDYDDEVDNAVAAMTSLLEPILIVLLAVIVGSIVIALFLPLIDLVNDFPGTGGAGGNGE